MLRKGDLVSIRTIQEQPHFVGRCDGKNLDSTAFRSVEGVSHRCQVEDVYIR